MTKRTLTNRKWRTIGVIGNVLMFLITGAAAATLLFVGIEAMFNTTTGAYNFMHQNSVTGVLLATIVACLGVSLFLIFSCLFLKYAWRLLKFAGRSLFKMLERQMKKESNMIQETLRRKQAKAISAIRKGIDRKIERGRSIKKEKEILG